MITPDDLARRFAPPLTAGALYDRQIRFSDRAYEVAEQALDALPTGHHLDQVVIALESAVHWMWAGLSAIEAEREAEAEQVVQQVPYAPAPAGAAAVPPAGPSSSIGAGLDLDVSVWRTGIRHALTLHPLARLVALILAEAAGPSGYIADPDQPSIEDLAYGTGLDGPNLLGALEELAERGWISRHTDGAATRFQLRLPVPNPR